MISRARRVHGRGAGDGLAESGQFVGILAAAHAVDLRLDVEPLGLDGEVISGPQELNSTPIRLGRASPARASSNTPRRLLPLIVAQRAERLRLVGRHVVGNHRLVGYRGQPTSSDTTVGEHAGRPAKTSRPTCGPNEILHVRVLRDESPRRVARPASRRARVSAGADGGRIGLVEIGHDAHLLQEAAKNGSVAQAHGDSHILLSSPPLARIALVRRLLRCNQQRVRSGGGHGRGRDPE